jgi:hypothetical protein
MLGVVASAVALLLGVCCSVAALSGLASPQPDGAERVITLDITVPSEPTSRTIRLTTREGEAALLNAAALGRFAFVPHVLGDTTPTVTVAVFDDSQSPRRRLAEVVVRLKEKPVRAEMSPPFEIGVSRIASSEKLDARQ